MYMYHNKLTSLLHVIMVDVSKSQQILHALSKKRKQWRYIEHANICGKNILPNRAQYLPSK